MKVEMKESGVDWIGKIPSNWEIKRNKKVFDCYKLIVGKNSSQTQLLSLTTKGIKEKDINNKEGKLPESFDTYQYVKKNNIVMCLFDLDVSAVFSGLSKYEGMISPAYKVLSCKKELYPKFADYWFKYISDGRKFNHYAKNIRFTLTYDEFSYLPIVSPPFDLQINIGNYLDTKCSIIDSIIEKQQAVIEKLKLYKRSLITETVTKGLNPNVEMKDSGVEWMGKIPKHWLCPKISYIASTASGATPSRNNKEYWNGTVKWIKTGELQNKELYDSEEKITEKGLLESSAKLFKENTILIAMYGQGKTRGMTGLLKINSSTNQACAGITVTSDKINFNFLWKFLIGAYDGLRQLAVGSGQPNLNLNLINNFKVTLPPIVEQIDIVNYLNFKGSAIDLSIEKKQKIIEKLHQYKKSLIYEVVTGKKAV